jgi:hypothetical protein
MFASSITKHKTLAKKEAKSMKTAYLPYNNGISDLPYFEGRGKIRSILPACYHHGDGDDKLDQRISKCEIFV